MGNGRTGEKPATEVKEKVKSILPKMYKVVLLNDDYTPMDFVVSVLITFFEKPASEATKIMIDVHNKGKGVCGVYIYDIAKTKSVQVNSYAQENSFPLKCVFEPE